MQDMGCNRKHGLYLQEIESGGVVRVDKGT